MTDELGVTDHGHGTPVVVIESAGHATLQDLGRPGLGHLGIVGHGAADRWSAQLANALVGNPLSAPLIEVTASGLVVRTNADTLMAVTGALVDVTRDGHSVALPGPFPVAAGTRVVISAPLQGLRSYVSLAAGLIGPTRLGSVAPDLTLELDNRLGAGDAVELRACLCGYHHPHLTHPVFRLGPAPQRWSTTVHVEFTLGPESAEFEDDALADRWQVSDRSNHIGLRLEGTSPTRQGLQETRSRGVPVGAIEVPPNGGLLVLLRGRLLTAGYPVVGVATSAATDRLAQARPGDTVTFRRFDTRSAIDQARTRHSEMQTLARRAHAALGAAGVLNALTDSVD
jgi:5-oxoprolinase (ATP-hydrolysing) subunit C